MNYALLLSGGTGTRAKMPSASDTSGMSDIKDNDLPKQYVSFNGHMMITYAIMPLLKCRYIDFIYIVADEAYREQIMTDIEKAGLHDTKIKGSAYPGANRQCSILNGMEAILSDRAGEESENKVDTKAGFNDSVLIHDAARPMLSADLLDRCYEALGDHDGVMPVLPMKDTVYRSADGNKVSELLNRSEIFAGQAPELFRLKPYYEANVSLLPDRILHINGATEPAIMAGMDIAMITGDERNYKVTTSGDMERFREEVEKACI